MFGFSKKDPVKNLEKEYYQLLEQARDKQRNGDIKGYALIIEKSELVLSEIERLRKS